MNSILDDATRLISMLFKSPLSELLSDNIRRDYKSEPTSLFEFFYQFVGTDKMNFYPSDTKGRCHKKAMFVSLSKKPPHAKKLKTKELIPLDKMLPKVIQHMQGSCMKTTKSAVIITDKIDTDVIKPWEDNLKQIQGDESKELLFIFVKENGEFQIINDLVGLAPF